MIIQLKYFSFSFENFINFWMKALKYLRAFLLELSKLKFPLNLLLWAFIRTFYLSFSLALSNWIFHWNFPKSSSTELLIQPHSQNFKIKLPISTLQKFHWRKKETLNLNNLPTWIGTGSPIKTTPRLRKREKLIKF